jgi:hypothetical protein
MASPFTNNTKNNALILVTFAAVSVCSTSEATFAQDPIRVETNQVLIPVYVLDEGRLRSDLRSDPDGNLNRAILAGDTQLVDAIEEGIVIHDLTPTDFQLFQDGKQQPIQNVAYEHSLYWDVHDNKGHHTEYIGFGGGKWSTAEWPPNVIGDIEPPHYLIAYTPPESPDGSCHHIKVKVKRRNAFIAARNEYCNTKHSASDPLNGTRLGKQIESDLSAPKNNKVDVSLFAMALYTSTDAARVHIALDWPWSSLKRELATRGLMGIVLRKDGSIVTRFSDLSDREGIPDRTFYDSSYGIYVIAGGQSRYERQLNLPPGEYDLRVVLSDGTKFGRAEIPLIIDSYDRKELALSAISLCKQISDVSAYSPRHVPKLPGSWSVEAPGDYLPLISEDIEYKPTGNTRFKKGETLYTYFQVYEPSLAGATPATVKIQFRVFDLRTSELKSDSGPVSAERYVRAGNPVIPIGIGIDITKLMKGSYRLEVLATDSAGQSTPWRTASFAIE